MFSASYSAAEPSSSSSSSKQCVPSLTTTLHALHRTNSGNDGFLAACSPPKCEQLPHLQNLAFYRSQQVFPEMTTYSPGLQHRKTSVQLTAPCTGNFDSSASFSGVPTILHTAVKRFLPSPTSASQSQNSIFDSPGKLNAAASPWNMPADVAPDPYRSFNPYSPQSIASTWSPNTMGISPQVPLLGTQCTPQGTPWFPGNSLGAPVNQSSNNDLSRRSSHQPFSHGRTEMAWTPKDRRSFSATSSPALSINTINSAPGMLMESCVEEEEEFVERQDLVLPLRSPLVRTLECLGLNDDEDYMLSKSNQPSVLLTGSYCRDMSGSSRALWVGNLPAGFKSAELKTMFERYGAIESVRILPHKNCGFVNYFDVTAAVRAHSQLNGRQLVPGSKMPIKITFAKIQTESPEPDTQNLMLLRCKSDEGIAMDDERKFNLLPGEAEYLRDFAEGSINIPAKNKYKFCETIMPLKHLENMSQMSGKPLHSVDPARLRELKKKLDTGGQLIRNFDSIFNELLPQIIELSTDSVGNTVVQKLIEHSSMDQLMQIVEKCASQLAAISIHKNGTYVVQKILECSAANNFIVNLLISSLLPYIPLLMTDPFGNYVVQGCVKLMAPFNQFVFDIMYSKCLSLGQTKFGARSMRACLENPCAKKEQLKLVAEAVIQHASELGKNPNGILLLHWLLDNSNLSGRFYALTKRLLEYAPSFSNLKQTHIVLLKIIGQPWEPQARRLLIDQGLFQDQGTLGETLFSRSNGSNNPTELGIAVVLKCLQVHQQNQADYKSSETMIQMVRAVINSRMSSGQQEELVRSADGYLFKRLDDELYLH